MTEAPQSRAEKLGYLGLGLMGLPMSRRLLNAGYDVTVWNRSAAKAAPLVEVGARLAGSPHFGQSHDSGTTASTAYAEQEGWYLQRFGRAGDRTRR